MNMVADVAATPSFVAEASKVPATASSPLTQEVHRLADTLLPLFSRNPSRCVLLLDLGEAGTSSRWLATSVGAALGEALKTSIHVLSTDLPSSDESRLTFRSLQGHGCVVKSVAPVSVGSERTSLVDHLTELRAASQPVLLHAGREDVLPKGLLQGGAVDSVVLLARAARTRRAALHATVQRMTFDGVPLLGCVLLDRTHPIPEKLYQLL